MNRLIDNFRKIEEGELYKAILYIFGTYLHDKDLVMDAIDKIRLSLGSLPLVKAVPNENKEETLELSTKRIQKTVILEDGSYATTTVTEQDLEKESKEELKLRFRELVLEDSILGGVMVRNLARLFYKVRKDDVAYNKYGLSILMILCSLARYYQSNIYEFDQAVIDQIAYLLRAITNPEKFRKESDPLLETDFKPLKHQSGKED